MKKELKIFIIILVGLTIVMHYKEFLEYPLQHLKNFPNSGAYGLGMLHPIVFTAIVYIVLLLPRLMIRFFKKGK
ncbi:MAG: hypothetical protein KBA17_01835 [Aliarcobacter sp.]|nr:hypothetical protein [Aliarcobacter sp.]